MTLDPLTVVDDPSFLDALAAQVNLPDALKQEILEVMGG